MTDTSTRPFRLLIDGDAVEPGDGRYEIVNPATERVVGEAPNASVADAEAACAAARAALPAWKRTSPEERSALLLKVADLLDAAKDELVPLAQAETGATMRVVKTMQVPQSSARWCVDHLRGERCARIGHGSVLPRQAGSLRS